jgi:2-amino-4-hydroxy-6-hydroxymethyldihydropteridine diphosphokinase
LNAAEKAEPAKHIAYIGLGSNIEPEINLLRAVAALRQHVVILGMSSAWHAPALGTTGPDFLNAVLKIETNMPMDDLRKIILRPIEASLGRKRSANKNATRTIDLDILIFDDHVHDPHIWDFAHLVLPLAECHPDLVDPITHRSMGQISAELQPNVDIRKTSLDLSPELNK